ncbi:MAG: cyclic nucleotide-binding domain-containing protein, partial [Proteobacteria bacterium]|nr:cyclic nucleotide-binding domain-containing protein [Pseudomonadota bacterium]
PATQEYLRQLAFNQLRNYFPDQPIDQLRILLNNEVRTFNPHEILLREGETVTQLLLILSGNAESLAAGSQLPFKFTAGSLLGELPLLRDRPATGTYRATSYVHALLLPAAQYDEFLNLYADRHAIKDLAEKRIWLRQTPLFGGGIGYPVHNRVAMTMTATELEDGIVAQDDTNRDKLRLVRDGVLMRFVGDNVLETLSAGEFFNEGRSIFNRRPSSHMRTIGTAVVWDIPAAVIADIPIVRWKIFETYRLRLQMTRDALATQQQPVAAD